jgi:type IV secretory pathway TraG/TraD family ATPase VirD4
MVFNDVSGEVFEKTSGYLAAKGYKILRLDFSNSNNSESFNPLIECRSISDIQKVALLIVRNSSGESKGEIFWEQSSIMLLCLMMRYLVFHAEPQYRTLQNTLRLIETFAVDGAVVDKLFVKTNDEELLTAYKATIIVGDKTLQSIIATARTALSLFCDPEVCKTTATNSIDFNLLRKEPVALYVCNPLKDLMYFKPLSALFFQSLFNYSLSRLPEKNERSIFFILDEAATMRFPALSTTISNIRKFNAGILLCMQDEMALVSQYGQAEAHQIKTNCSTQIYLKGQPLHTCKELSQILGKRTLLDEKGHERTRELLTPDELRICEEAIILISNHPPLKCRVVPYFENIWMSNLTEMAPFQVTTKNAAIPPLIQFNAI